MKNGGDDLAAWTGRKTKAYAVGLNSIYLNVSGREGQGMRRCRTRSKTCWLRSKQNCQIGRMRTGHPSSKRCGSSTKPLTVPTLALARTWWWVMRPGTAPPPETGSGKIPAVAIEPNTEHWGADHCIEADAVPGVIFANRDLIKFGTMSFRDVPFLAIGKHLDQSHIKPPSQAAGEGQKDVEERLKGLGYL